MPELAFIAEAALIALREGLEALLIVGILLGLVTKLGRPDARKHVWLGFAAATVASIAVGFVIQRYLLTAFETQGGAEWFELGAVGVAVVVLTYMIFWMWKHTRGLMATLRREVESALTRGALVGVVVLTFASVIREGLEVVLFYGALASRATPIDLAWSGLLGFIASAIIVVAILRGAAKVDLQGFFAITGIILVFVAAGLLVHGVMAAMELGVIAPAPALWDTSAWLPEDGAVGRVLHALVGYAATPTLLQASLYFGYVFGIGGWYLWSLGAFHRRTTAGRALAGGRAAAVLIVVLLVVAAVGNGAANPGAIVSGHAHGPGEEDIHMASIPPGAKVGVLLRSHGEPIHYNETTYASFAEFVRGILILTGNEDLLLIDQGTVLIDAAHPYERGFRVDAQLMNAWTSPHKTPAFYIGTPVPAPQGAAVPFYDGAYIAPGGVGLGEPDILEMAGLSAWLSWQAMENESPMHETKGRMLDAAIHDILARHPDAVVETAYHILPRVGAGESVEEAARAFAAAGVDVVIDAYTTSVFSDVMDTCMMRPHVAHAFREAGYKGKILHSDQTGPTSLYAHAVAREVARLVADAPAGPTAVFLTHHGMRAGAMSPCGDSTDQYHENADALFAATLAAIPAHLQRDDVTFHQVYGQGASPADDERLSPMEALEAARAAGARNVIDLPYELTGDGYDNLVVQREGYGLAPAAAPHYDAAHETRFTWRSVDVRIASSAFESEARGAALADVVEQALMRAYAADDGHAHAH